MKKSSLVITALFLMSTAVFAQTKVIRVNPKAFVRGCGDFKVTEPVTVQGEKNTYIVLNADREKLKIGKDFTSHDVSKTPEITGSLEMLNKAGRSNYCTDALTPGLEVLHTYKLLSGTVKIRIVSEETADRFGKIPYLVDIVLEHAVFGSGRKKFTCGKIEFKNVRVNFML